MILAPLLASLAFPSTEMAEDSGRATLFWGYLQAGDTTAAQGVVQQSIQYTDTAINLGWITHDVREVDESTSAIGAAVSWARSSGEATT